ncbi:MAG: 5'-methylthioadenosine/S-adenosylhomocysteine nucleosidase [Pseudomonadota bacterium]
MSVPIIALISADAEWASIQPMYGQPCQQSPFGDWFECMVPHRGGETPVIFFHGGWGKIAAAASTQYVIDKWAPELIVNLGTCGGIRGRIQLGDIVIPSRTVVYDIYEQMLDSQTAIDFYTTEIDVSWVPEPLGTSATHRGVHPSADRDLDSKQIGFLINKFSAVAVDWESGAIAWTANRNTVPCLIVRAVTDLVGSQSADAYEDDGQWFKQQTHTVMQALNSSLPLILASWPGFKHRQ